MTGAPARFGPPAEETPPEGFELCLGVVTMLGHEFVLCRPPEGDAVFPHDAFRSGESPGAAAKRVVREWTGTTDPKLEIVDFVNDETPSGAWRLRFVFRAMLTADPQPTRRASAFEHVARGALPDHVGWISGKEAQEALQSSLNYKLTRG